MADEAPKPTPAGDEQADPLADELLSMGSFGDGGSGASPTEVQPRNSDSPSPEAAAPGLEELEALLKQANFDDPAGPAQDDLAARLIAEAHAAAAGEDHKPLPQTAPFDLPAFQQVISESQASSIDLLRDVELNVKIELGRSRMLVEDVLKLNEGSVVELDKLAGDPVDVFVNDRLVARGEVLVLNDNFCVRVNEIVQAVKEEV